MFNENEYKIIFETDEFEIMETNSCYYIDFKTENAKINVTNIEDFPNCKIVNIAILKEEYTEEGYGFKCSKCEHYKTDSLEFNKYGEYITQPTGLCRALHDMSTTDANTCPNYSPK